MRLARGCEREQMIPFHQPTSILLTVEETTYLLNAFVVLAPLRRDLLPLHQEVTVLPLDQIRNLVRSAREHLIQFLMEGLEELVQSGRHWGRVSEPEVKRKPPMRYNRRGSGDSRCAVISSVTSCLVARAR